MMTFTQLQQFLANFGVGAGLHKPITLERYEKLIVTATRWYGPVFAQWLADCFIPTGEAVLPGYEDSLSHYSFSINTWEELWPDFNEVAYLFTRQEDE